jgi:hypothetical protein
MLALEDRKPGQSIGCQRGQRDVKPLINWQVWWHIGGDAESGTPSRGRRVKDALKGHADMVDKILRSGASHACFRAR